MRLIGRLMIFWVVLLILANPFRMIAERFGIPNVSIPLREVLLYAMLLLTIPKSRMFQRPFVGYTLVAIIFFSVVYLAISGAEARHFEGLYFLRIYLVPFLFCYSLSIWLRESSELDLTQFFRRLLGINAVVVCAAVALYLLMQIQPSLSNVIFGQDKLPWSWFIAGGLQRMGLPFAAPNNLGTYVALSSLLFFPLFVSQRSLLPRRWLAALAVLNVVALLLTFSRSSLVTLVFGVIVFLTLPGVVSSKTAFKLLAASVVGGILLVAGLLVVDIFSNGAVERWLYLNLSLRDPSMQGHFRSVFDAIDRIQEYFFIGFERGTVGPKAQLFTLQFAAVENSVLGVLFDMGILCAVLYFLVLGMLLVQCYRGRFQWPVLLAFSVNAQLLPYVFEPEIVSYFFCVYACLGALQSHGLILLPNRSAAMMPFVGEGVSAVRRV